MSSRLLIVVRLYKRSIVESITGGNGESTSRRSDSSSKDRSSGDEGLERGIEMACTLHRPDNELTRLVQSNSSH